MSKMQATLSIPLGKVKLFQDLVKSHNLRFIGNPMLFKDRALITVDSDHLEPGKCNHFFNDWDRANKPIREIHTPTWKRVLRRFGVRVYV